MAVAVVETFYNKHSKIHPSFFTSIIDKPASSPSVGRGFKPPQVKKSIKSMHKDWVD